MKKILLLLFVCSSVFSEDIPVILQPFDWGYGWGYDLKQIVPEIIQDFEKSIRVENNHIIFPKDLFKVSDDCSSNLLFGDMKVIFEKDLSQNLIENDNNILFSMDTQKYIFILVNHETLEYSISKNKFIFQNSRDKIYFAPAHSEITFYNFKGGFSVSFYPNENFQIRSSMFPLFDGSRTEYEVGEIMGTSASDSFFEFFFDGEEVDVLPIFLYVDGLNSIRYIMKK